MRQSPLGGDSDGEKCDQRDSDRTQIICGYNIDMNIKEKLSKDLREAMKERNEIEIKTIRSLISAIDNAGAIVVEDPKIMPMSGGIAYATDGVGSTEARRKELSEKDIEKIIRIEINEIEKTIELVKQHSQLDVRQFIQRINILERYL